MDVYGQVIRGPNINILSKIFKFPTYSSQPSLSSIHTLCRVVSWLHFIQFHKVSYIIVKTAESLLFKSSITAKLMQMQKKQAQCKLTAVMVWILLVKWQQPSAPGVWSKYCPFLTLPIQSKGMCLYSCNNTKKPSSKQASFVYRVPRLECVHFV